MASNIVSCAHRRSQPPIGPARSFPTQELKWFLQDLVNAIPHIFFCERCAAGCNESVFRRRLEHHAIMLAEASRHLLVPAIDAEADRLEDAIANSPQRVLPRFQTLASIVQIAIQAEGSADNPEIHQSRQGSLIVCGLSFTVKDIRSVCTIQSATTDANYEYGNPDRPAGAISKIRGDMERAGFKMDRKTIQKQLDRSRQIAHHEDNTHRRS